jgi:AhpD family alkylhydroperoxidase
MAGPRIGPGTARELGLPAYLFSRAAGRVTRTQPPAVFTTLGRGRRTFWGWLGFAASVLAPFGPLSRREQELVVLRVAHLRESDYEWSHHTRLGRRAGVTSGELERLRAPSPDQSWAPRELAMLTATDVLVATRDLDEDTWARLREQLSERETVDFLLLFGQYDMLATTLRVLRLSPDARRLP